MAMPKIVWKVRTIEWGIEAAVGYFRRRESAATRLAVELKRANRSSAVVSNTCSERQGPNVASIDQERRNMNKNKAIKATSESNGP